MSDVVTLDDLVQPIGVERFIAEHWLSEQPFLSEPNPALVARLRELDVFASPEALCRRLTRPVTLLGPHQFRGVVAASEAHAFMHQGYTLYVRHLDAQVPEVRRLSQGAAEALGMANLTVNVEAFVARAGAISSAHFDHDINFQILLSGRKRWRVAANRHVRNPFRGYHPAKQPDGSYQVELDEAYARDPDVPVQMPDPDRVFEATAGTIMFVPRAWWHEVDSLEDCFAINFAVTGSTWANGFSVALGDVLAADELAREFCYGALAQNEAARGHATERFETVRRRAIEQLEAITLEEVYLAGRDGRWRWSAAARERTIVETASGWVLAVPGIADEPLELDEAVLGLMRKLVRLEHPFSWGQLAVIAGEEIRGAIGAVGLWNLVTDLTAAGYLAIAPASSTAL